MNYTPSTIRILTKLKKSAKKYKELMSLQYLIVYESNYIEVNFSKKCFKHLTGIQSSLKPKDFFDNSCKGMIKYNQISFDKQHPYQLCDKKLDSIIRLKDSFNSDLLLLHNINTATYIIPKGITDLDFVLGFDINDDKNGNKVDDNLVPYTLRVGDKNAFSCSKKQFQVDFILSKLKTDSKYSNLCFGRTENIHSLPSDIKALIDFETLFK